MNKSDKLILELYLSAKVRLSQKEHHGRFEKALDAIDSRGKQLHEKQLAMERASIKCDEQE